MNTHLLGTREAWLDRAPKRRNEDWLRRLGNIEALTRPTIVGRSCASRGLRIEIKLRMAESAFTRKLPVRVNQ